MTHHGNRLARLQALLTGMPEERELRLLLEQLDSGPDRGTFSWLDQRKTSLALLPGSAAGLSSDWHTSLL